MFLKSLKMSTCVSHLSGFRFDLFDPIFSDVLSNCRFLNLPFEIPHVYEEVNYLLTQCGETFFCHTSDTNFSEKFIMCIENANIVIDMAWEKINTGYWKDVDKNWRYAYTFGSLFKVLCLLIDDNPKKFDIIKFCDMGLLMGAPLMQNILSKIAFKLSSILMEESNEEYPDKRQIKKLENCMSEDVDLKYPVSFSKNMNVCDFKNKYIKDCKPVKIVAAICDWPALSTNAWSIEYIMNIAQYRTVPIEIGSKYTDEKWTQKLMTIGEFINNYIANKSELQGIGYLAQHNIFDQIPELFDDIKIPAYITENYGDVNVDISIYFGPAGTVSPLHHDPKHNLLAQVIGKKYLRLYSKEMTECLYPRYNTWLSNTSEVDVESPDLEAFPLFTDAQYEECILNAGDVLYIPPGHWHYVRSCSVSLSISFWWDVPDI